MGKNYLISLLVTLLPFLAMAQPNLADSLQRVLANATDDSTRFDTNRKLYTYYEEKNRDSALYYTTERLALARKAKKKIVEAYVMGQAAYQLTYLGRFGEALQYLLQGITIAEDPGNDEKDSWLLSYFDTPGKRRLQTLSLLNHMFSHLMLQTENLDEQLYRLNEGRRIALQINNSFRIVVADMVLGSSYITRLKADSAMFYAQEAEKEAMAIGLKRYFGYIWFVMGDVYLQKGDHRKAEEYYHRALQSSFEQNNINNAVGSYVRLIALYRQEKKNDSVLLYSLKNLEAVRSLGAVTAAAAHEINIGTAYEEVATGYTLATQFDSAFKYQGLALKAKDSINRIRIKRLGDFQSLSLNEALRLQNIEKEKVVYQNRIRTYSMLAGILGIMIVAFLLYRNSRNRRKANAILQKQKEELQAALSELKATQSQLIQSEKMASLGELTAGIAHEIQNPLNFVNNFSELSKELLGEMRLELENGNIEDAWQIANDIIQNLEKINHHGKRADAIVKGMLQHSQSSSGIKEPTDINALADEFIRLCYHGLRAKDKSFNATIKTDFETSLEKVNVIPQDIGRVILNILTNAFYAVNERKKLSPEGYEPTVTVSTKKGINKVEIKISDNGNGIPARVLDKIFQPFFTTKPTGQGTGLGLSLSYDIITKGHGGELKIETKEVRPDEPVGPGEGSSFIIQLPV